MATIIATVTRDATVETYDDPTSDKGRVFEYGAFVDFWARQNFGGFDLPPNFLRDLAELPNTPFRLYDDDGGLNYEGWLKDDDEALVQQFVLAWAMGNAGSTVIKVQQKGGKWVQVIG